MYRLNRPVILLDGKIIDLKAYNIKDNNYFKLRDIGALIDFGIQWNSLNNQIEINTSENYEGN